ncbi:MAG: hypothetical protein NC177_08295 [Ruminococcus flavefaciens]|nr:hypothetical protein [Ruminococcus flavefaciens]
MRKGIVYRELYLNRKRYIIGFAVYVAMLFVGILLRMSMSFGNLANVDEETFKSMDMLTYYLFTLATPVIFIVSFAETPELIVSDYKVDWLKFSYTFPVSPKETALYKTGITLAGFLLSVVVSIINFTVFSKLCDRKFDIFSFKIMLVIILVFCLTTATEQILTYKFKNITLTQVVTSLIFTVIFIAIILVAIVYMSGIMKKFDGDDEAMNRFLDGMGDKMLNFLDIFVIFVPFIIAGIFVLEYVLTKKILERREN